MKQLWFGMLSLVLVWAAHAPAESKLAPSFEAHAIAPKKESFWKRLKTHVLRPLLWGQRMLKAFPQSDQELIRLLIIILIVALIVSLVVWLLPWPLDVIIMVLALVVALIFLLRYLR